MWRCVKCKTIVETLDDDTRCACVNPDPEDQEWERVKVVTLGGEGSIGAKIAEFKRQHPNVHIYR